MSDEWPLSEEIRNVECYTDEYGVQCPLVMDEERVDWANRAAVLEADNARFRDALGQAQADSSWHRSEAARLMNLLIEAQANGNHLRRALEWLAREFAAHDKLVCPERCGGACVFWMSEEDEEAGAPCEERVTDDMPRGCWITAALAATEEASR